MLKGRNVLNMKIFWVVLFLLTCPAVGLRAMPSADQAQFEKAAIAYRENKFDEAAALYQALSNKHPEAAVFYYDLGNALQRKGEIGTAILAYERARFLAPRNSDINDNLKYVKSLIEYRIEDKRNEMVKVAELVLGYVTLGELWVSVLGLSFLLLASWAGVLFFKRDRSWGIFRKSLLLLSFIFLALFLVKSIQVNFFREAIVIAKKAQVYYGPSVTDQAAFQLGEGLKVYEMDDRVGWSRILIASGESGWIQAESIAEIRPRTL